MPDGVARIHVEVSNPDALFDGERGASFPHRGRMVDEGLADYFENSARAARKLPAVTIEVASRGAPAGTEVEARARADFRAYFEAELSLAGLDERVNRTEGRGSFRHALPMLLTAGIVALIVYLIVGANPPQSFVLAFLVAATYLIFITIVWVLLWDPFEKLVFDGYMLQARSQALGKLIRANLEFAYAGAAPTPPGKS